MLNMITYELAKELKDAGFPKEGFIVCDGKSCNMQGEPHWFNEPTLSELIEACGDGFLGMIKNTDWQDEERSQKWFAGHIDGEDFQAFIDKNIPFGKGSTPDIAVAKLWLALNKK